jgi:serine/threonine protein kinase
LSAAKILEDVIHAAGVAQNDIAPRNILISTEGEKTRIVFVDFGNARFSESQEWDFAMLHDRTMLWELLFRWLLVDKICGVTKDWG